MEHRHVVAAAGEPLHDLPPHELRTADDENTHRRILHSGYLIAGHFGASTFKSLSRAVTVGEAAFGAIPSSSVMAYWPRSVAMMRSVSGWIEEIDVLRSWRPPLMAVTSDSTRCSAAPSGASLPPRSTTHSVAPLARTARAILVGDMTSVWVSAWRRVTAMMMRRAGFSNDNV